jgi:hypothetical protein
MARLSLSADRPRQRLHHEPHAGRVDEVLAPADLDGSDVPFASFDVVEDA